MNVAESLVRISQDGTDSIQLHIKQYSETALSDPAIYTWDVLGQ